MKKILIVALLGVFMTSCSIGKKPTKPIVVPQQTTPTGSSEIEQILGDALDQYTRDFFTSTEVKDTLVNRTLEKLKEPTKTFVVNKVSDWAQHNQENSRKPVFPKYALAKPGSKEAIVNSFYATLEQQFKSESVKFVDIYRKTMAAEKAKDTFAEQCVKNTLDKMKSQLMAQFTQLEQKWKLWLVSKIAKYS